MCLEEEEEEKKCKSGIGQKNIKGKKGKNHIQKYTCLDT